MTVTHQRIYEQLEAYWQDQRKGRIYPSEQDINPQALTAIWDYCFLVSILDADVINGYKYTYLGDGLIEAFGSDITKQGVSKRLIDTSSQPLIHAFEEVIRTGAPLRDEGEFTNNRKMLIKYRSCVLPLGADPDRVDYILGAMKWKAF